MKHLPTLAGALLGLMFIAFAGMFFLNLAPEQAPPPEGSPVAAWMASMVPTGYLAFVKACELAGGVLVAIPKTRNFGLLILGPIIINILAFHQFVARDGVFQPVLLVLSALALYLLWAGRKAFLNLRGA